MKGGRASEFYGTHHLQKPGDEKWHLSHVRLVAEMGGVMEVGCSLNVCCQNELRTWRKKWCGCFLKAPRPLQRRNCWIPHQD